jgi:hypothetical protein
MFALITLLSIVTVSFLVVRAGSVALTLTGLSTDSANFQAQSAFMGVGFTTQEAESVVAHPVRRKIIRILMLLGFLFMGSALASIITAFAGTNHTEWGMRALWMLLGIGAIFLLGSLQVVRNGLTRLLEKALTRFGAVEVRDYEELLRLSKGFSISTIQVEAGSWLAGNTLGELRLTDEGVIVLNVSREGGTAVAMPGVRTLVEPGDRLLCYGLEDDLTRLVDRPASYGGDVQREIAIHRHRARRSAEESVDSETLEAEKAAGELAGSTEDHPPKSSPSS